MTVEGLAGQHDLLVLSNRGPLSISRTGDGLLAARKGGGGLVVTLGPGVERDGALWVAAGVGADDEEAARRGLFEAEGLRVWPVMIDAEDYRAYYDVIANQTLWFCLHGLWDLPRRPRFDRYWWTAWDRFRAVNERFAAAASAAAAPGATVLVQDYQLALVPAMLAAKRPDLRTAAFLHTPWCSAQELATLPDPVASELLAGLAGGGACGFHSDRWAHAFEECCRQRLGRTPVTFVSPAAADVDDLRSVASSAQCGQELARLNETIGHRRLVVRVDRIELSKNVLRGFWAFDELLSDRGPDLQGRWCSRRWCIRPACGAGRSTRLWSGGASRWPSQINARWGQPAVADRAAWTPILHRSARTTTHGRSPPCGAATCCWSTPSARARPGGRGRPLINEHDGMLVLSDQAGVWDEARGAVLPSATTPSISPARLPGAWRWRWSCPAGPSRPVRAGALREVTAARSAAWTGSTISERRPGPGGLVRGVIAGRPDSEGGQERAASRALQQRYRRPAGPVDGQVGRLRVPLHRVSPVRRPRRPE